MLGWQNVKRALKGQLYSQQFYSDFGFDTNLIIQHRSAVDVDQCPSFHLTQSCEMLQNVTPLFRIKGQKDNVELWIGNSRAEVEQVTQI